MTNDFLMRNSCMYAALRYYRPTAVYKLQVTILRSQYQNFDLEFATFFKSPDRISENAGAKVAQTMTTDVVTNYVIQARPQKRYPFDRRNFA